MRAFVLASVSLLACATSPAKAPSHSPPSESAAPAAAAPGAPPVAVVAKAPPEPPPPPYCREFDSLRVDAYWNPLPGPEHTGWIRIESGAAFGTIDVSEPLKTKGCTRTHPLQPPSSGVAISVGCVPDPLVSTVEVSGEFLCRLGAGRKQLIARIVADPHAKPGVLLPIEIDRLPETPAIERNGGTEQAVWRSREELPSWLSDQVPPDFDFAQKMLAGPDRGPVGEQEVAFGAPERSADTPGVNGGGPGGAPRMGDRAVFHRVEHVAQIHYYRPPPVCDVCSGVYRPRPPRPVKRDPLRIWVLPSEPGVKVFVREHFEFCPPCSAPSFNPPTAAPGRRSAAPTDGH